MKAIEFESVAKRFADGTLVFDGLSMQVNPNEVVTIRGNNGTGKTTLLRMVAGLETPTQGSVKVRSGTRRSAIVGYVPQDYAASLLPWLDVLDNIALPLRVRGWARGRRRAAALALLERLDFPNLPPNSRPHQLSGGQKQRVAIARALIHRPDILLFDEPFANLDLHTRRELVDTLSEVQHKLGPTTVYASHSVDDSILLSDRIIVLHGRPATIALDLEVRLKRPRSHRLLTSPDFSPIRRRLLTQEEALLFQDSNG